MKLKRILSFILVTIMISTMFIIVPTSAAINYDTAVDGDVLYEVLFNQLTGVYTPSVINHNEDTTKPITTAIPSADGKEIVFTKPTEAKGKRWFFGDNFDGLTIAEGKKYTIELRAKVDVLNFGMYFNFGQNDVEVGEYYAGLFGYYGSPQNVADKTDPKITKVNDTLAYGGSKLAGQYRCNGNDYYVADDVKVTPDVDGYVTMSIEVDGYSFSVFKNGVFFDKAYISPDSPFLNLGLSFYLYNAGTLTIKDAKVIKGLKYSSVAEFKYPETKRFEAPTYGDAKVLNAAAYDGAELGKKLADINFKTMDDYKPVSYMSLGAKETVTISEDGKSVSIEKGATAGATWWGAAIGDLKITQDTKYTFKYKIKANKGNAGVYFNINEANPDTRYNFGTYGSFTNDDPAKTPSIVIQRGSSKIAGTVQNTTSYVPITPLLDANGYVDLAIEVNGYTWTVYYIGADGQYVKHDEYTANDTEILFGGSQLGLAVYIYNVGATMSLTDVELYKGLVISTVEDEETTAPQDTTAVPVDTTVAPVDTTKAPETTKAPATTTKAPETTEEVKKGCGKSAVAIQLVALICGAGLFVIVKKRH